MKTPKAGGVMFVVRAITPSHLVGDVLNALSPYDIDISAQPIKAAPPPLPHSVPKTVKRYAKKRPKPQQDRSGGRKSLVAPLILDLLISAPTRTTSELLQHLRANGYCQNSTTALFGTLKAMRKQGKVELVTKGVWRGVTPNG
jgi:hypothetical protein